MKYQIFTFDGNFSTTHQNYCGGSNLNADVNGHQIKIPMQENEENSEGQDEIFFGNVGKNSNDFILRADAIQKSFNCFSISNESENEAEDKKSARTGSLCSGNSIKKNGLPSEFLGLMREENSSSDFASDRSNVEVLVKFLQIFLMMGGFRRFPYLRLIIYTYIKLISSTTFLSCSLYLFWFP